MDARVLGLGRILIDTDLDTNGTSHTALITMPEPECTAEKRHI